MSKVLDLLLGGGVLYNAVNVNDLKKKLLDELSKHDQNMTSIIQQLTSVNNGLSSLQSKHDQNMTSIIQQLTSVNNGLSSLQSKHDQGVNSITQQIAMLANRDIVGMPFVNDNLDSIFIGAKIGAGTYGVYKDVNVVKASDYWTTNGLRCPSDASEIAVWTRRTFRYPKATVIAKLPQPDPGAFYYPIALFSTASSEWNGPIEMHVWGNDQYDIFAPPVWRTSVKGARVIIQDLLPSDWNTAYHTYTVKVNKWGVELYIDGVLRAVLLASYKTTAYSITGKPYAIGIGYLHLSSEYVFGIRVGNTSSDPTQWQERILPISPHFVAVADGDPAPPRAYQLYVPDTDTPLAGQSISSGSITSHPVPIFGYSNKTLMFMADQAGTLSIQVLTLSGNWREYDSVSITANKLLAYKIDKEALLARVVYTPQTTPANILEGEVYLS